MGEVRQQNDSGIENFKTRCVPFCSASWQNFKRGLVTRQKSVVARKHSMTMEQVVFQC